MALHGAGFALLLVGGVTYVAARAPSGSAATAQGVLAGVVFGLAQAIGPGIAGLIAGAASIHSMFTFAAIASAVGLVAVGLAVSSGARSARSAVMSPRLTRNRLFPMAETSETAAELRPIEAQDYREVLTRFATGVTVVTTLEQTGRRASAVGHDGQLVHRHLARPAAGDGRRSAANAASIRSSSAPGVSA